MRRILLAFAGPILLTGCASVDRSADGAVVRAIPTYPHDPVVSAGLRGRLALVGDCLILSIPARKQTFLPIWPQGSRFDGRRVTAALPGKPAVTLLLGRDVAIGGSGRGWQNVPKSLGLAEVARQCPFEPFFVAEVG